MKRRSPRTLALIANGARRVHAIDAEVQQRTAAARAPGADVAFLDLHRERGREEPRAPDVTAPHALDCVQGRPLEVQAIRGHQLDAVVRAGPQHPLCVRAVRGDRFFAQHMNAAPRRPDDVIGVFVVG
jgi:hypothetical protein